MTSALLNVKRNTKTKRKGYGAPMKIKAPFYFEQVKSESILYRYGVRFYLYGRAIGLFSLKNPNKPQGRTSASIIGVKQ